MPFMPSVQAATRSLPLLFSAGLLTLLAGCGGGGGGGGGTPTPTPTSTVARFAFVANAGDDTLSAFIADNTTGALRHHGYVPTGSGPTGVVVDPSGAFVYTLNETSTDIGLFQLDSLAGTLSEANCDTVTPSTTCSTGGTPVSMVFEPNGRFAYVANQGTNTLTAHAKDSSTGALSDIATQPAIDVTAHNGDTPVRLRVHPDGGFLYVAYDASDNVGVYAISASDGTLTHVTGSPVDSGGTGAADVAITPDGQYAYVANLSGEIGVFTIDATGLLVANGSPLLPGGVTSAYALAIDSSGSRLYMLSQEVSGSVTLFDIQSDGTLVQRDCGSAQTCPTGGVPESIAIDPTGQFLSVTNGGDNTISTFAIDQTTGKLSALRGLAARDTPSALAYTSDTAEVTVTPRFAYVANYTGASLSAFSINSGSGRLTAIGTTVATSGKPTSVNINPAGSRVYATNEVTDDVSVYNINSSTGALTQLSGSPFSLEAPETGPQSIVIDPSGRFAYVANSTDSISAFSVNASTGALTLLTNAPYVTGDNPGSVTIDPTGRFLYTANINSDDVTAFRIDHETGELTLIGTVAAENTPNSIAADPTGRFIYAANVGIGAYNVSAYSIDASSGALSEITGSPFAAGSAPFSLSVDPLGEFVYVANQSSRTVTPYTINQTTGALTAGTDVATESNPQSITVDPSGQYVYVANYGSNSVSGYSINASSGALTTTGSSVATGTDPRSIVATGVVQ